MPIEVSLFEDELRWIKGLIGDERFGYFIYNGEDSFKKVVESHFSVRKGTKKYGVYIVKFQKSNEVIYIGKGGTIEQNGNFAKQDIPNRLTNTRKGNKSANATFLEYYNNGGSLHIEYLILLDNELCPGLIETFLLQAYLKEHKRLPQKNIKL